jgi:hypothetical protein
MLSILSRASAAFMPADERAPEGLRVRQPLAGFLHSLHNQNPAS